MANMDANWAIDAKGRRVVDTVGYILVGYPTKAQKPTAFANGKPFPANRGIDTSWRLQVTAAPGGHTSANGVQKVAFLGADMLYRSNAMEYMWRDASRTHAERNNLIFQYRAFLDNYGSATPEEKAEWLAIANDLVPPSGWTFQPITAADIDADAVQAANPRYNLTQDSF